jgi:hypothetical protein
MLLFGYNSKSTGNKRERGMGLHQIKRLPCSKENSAFKDLL